MLYIKPWLAYFLKNDCAAGDNFQNELTTSSDVNFRQTQSIGHPVMPELSLAGTNTLCNGDSLLLAVNNSFNGSWNNTSNDSNIIIATNGAYFFTNYNDQNRCPLGSDTLFLTAGSVEILDVVVSDVSGCGINDGSINISANGTVVLNYSINNGLSFQSNPVFQNLAPGNYLVMVQNDLACFKKWDTITISGFQDISTPESIGDTVFYLCYGDDVPVLSINEHMYDYTWWSDVSHTQNVNVGVQYQPLSPLINDTTLIFVSAHNGNCVSADLVFKIYQYKALSGGSISGDQTVCEGDFLNTVSSVDLAEGGNISNGYAYQWFGSNNNGITWDTLAGETNVNLLLNYVLETTLFKRAVNNVCGLAYSNSINVNVTPKPIVLVNAPASFCLGSSNNLSICVSGSDLYINTCNGILNNNCYNVNVDSSGIFNCEIIGIKDGCYSDTTEISVVIYPIPFAAVIHQSNDTLYSNYINAAWYNSSGQIVSQGSYFVPLINDDYYAVGIDGNGCESSSSNVITVTLTYYKAQSFKNV